MKDVTAYSLHKLMDIPDISITAMFQSLPSRTSFFEYMDTVLLLGHEILDGFAGLDLDGEELPRYMDRVALLEKRLLDINAAKAVWAVEQFSAMLATGSAAQVRHQFQGMERVLLQLITKIERSKISSGGEAAPDFFGPAPATPASAPGSISPAPLAAAPGGRLKAQAKPEMFEKVAVLINNFEINYAMQQLEGLESFTFSDEIDNQVSAIHACLAKFAYDEAAAKTQALIQFLGTGQNGAAGEKKKILAVDDMPVVLSAVKSMLDDHYTVCCVTNHMAALQYLTNNYADLVLLDIEMPDMDGFTLLSIIRKMERYKNVPVIFLTSHASAEHVKTALELGGNDYIKKPVDADILLGKLAKHLS